MLICFPFYKDIMVIGYVQKEDFKLSILSILSPHRPVFSTQNHLGSHTSAPTCCVRTTGVVQGADTGWNRKGRSTNRNRLLSHLRTISMLFKTAMNNILVSKREITIPNQVLTSFALFKDASHTAMCMLTQY